jgi:hypothetical protein
MMTMPPLRIVGVDDIGRREAVDAQRGDKRQRPPVTMGHARDEALTARRTPVVPDHLRRDRGLVDKDEACCTQLGLLSFQHSALDSDVADPARRRVVDEVRSLWDFDADLAAETGERFDAPDSMPMMSWSTLRLITFMSNLLQSLLKFIFRQQHEITRPAGGTIETSLLQWTRPG